MRKAFWLLFALALPALAQDPVLPAVTAIHTAPTLGELPPPESLRPCCAFGYDLHVARRAFRSRCTRSVMC